MSDYVPHEPKVCDCSLFEIHRIGRSLTQIFICRECRKVYWHMGEEGEAINFAQQNTALTATILALTQERDAAYNEGVEAGILRLELITEDIPDMDHDAIAGWVEEMRGVKR